MLTKKIEALKKDIAELDAWTTVLRNELDELNKQFDKESKAFGKMLEEMADQYVDDVMNNRDTDNPELKRALSKVMFRRSSSWKGQAVYEYFPAATAIADYCERKTQKSIILQSDTRLKTIQAAIIGDDMMIAIGDKDKDKYGKKFLSTVLFFTQLCEEDVDTALGLTKEILEGRAGCGIDTIDEYLYGFDESRTKENRSD